MTDLNPHRGYTPVSRAHNGIRSPIKEIMAVRSAALVDRARIAAEVANQEFLIHERMDASFNQREHLVTRLAEASASDDPRVQQFDAFLVGASFEAMVNLMQGDDQS